MAIEHYVIRHSPHFVVGEPHGLKLVFAKTPSYTGSIYLHFGARKSSMVSGFFAMCRPERVMLGPVLTASFLPVPHAP